MKEFSEIPNDCHLHHRRKAQHAWQGDPENICVKIQHSECKSEFGLLFLHDRTHRTQKEEFERAFIARNKKQSGQADHMLSSYMWTEGSAYELAKTWRDERFTHLVSCVKQPTLNQFLPNNRLVDVRLEVPLLVQPLRMAARVPDTS